MLTIALMLLAYGSRSQETTEPTVAEEVAALIVRTNVLESFHAIYDATRPEEYLAETRATLEDTLASAEAAYSESLVAVESSRTAPRQELYDLEQAVVAELWTELLRDPLLTHAPRRGHGRRAPARRRSRARTSLTMARAAVIGGNAAGARQTLTRLHSTSGVRPRLRQPCRSTPEGSSRATIVDRG